jgi:hypoxanthine phosphoribosyltransferase
MIDAEVTARSLASRPRLLLDAETIQARVRDLGREIARDYAGRRPLLVGILKGAAIFLADLARAIEIDLEYDFVSLASYGSRTMSTGAVRLIHDLRGSVADRDVIIVEGIVDTGHSIQFLLELLAPRGARSVSVCALLDKSECRLVPVPLRSVGFRIGNEFVVGYGMDAAETYRQLPYVGVIETVPPVPPRE